MKTNVLLLVLVSILFFSCGGGIDEAEIVVEKDSVVSNFSVGGENAKAFFSQTEIRIVWTDSLTSDTNSHYVGNLKEIFSLKQFDKSITDIYQVAPIGSRVYRVSYEGRIGYSIFGEMTNEEY